MKKLFIISLLFIGCTTTQPVVNTTPKKDIVYIQSSQNLVTRQELKDSITSLQESSEVHYAYDPAETFYRSVIDARGFGAVGDGVHDDYDALQRAADFCIVNNIRKLYLPIGRYKTSQPIIIKPQAGSMFCTLEISGESTWWDSNAGSNIYYTGTTGAAIIIQKGKGCVIRNLRLQGVFTPPPTNNYNQFYNLTFEQFKDGVCDVNKNHPHAGIAIDYFANSDGSVSGSTGTLIENCEITNFYVGIISSPNGTTLNAENTKINLINFENVNTCIASCQAQEKVNTVTNISCWGTAYQIFSTGQFGAGQGSNYNISHVNVAGAVVQLMYLNQQGWFLCSFNDWYAESVGRLGTVYAYYVNVSFSNCHFDFALPIYAGQQTVVNANGKYVVFRDCTFRYFSGESNLIHIAGDALYDHCFFGWGAPVVDGGSPTFINGLN